MKKRGKFLLVAIALTLSAFSDTEIVDGIKWTFTIHEDEVAVGGGTFKSDRAVPTSTKGRIAIPSRLAGLPVTKISDFAFHSCKHLTAIKVPYGICSIGDAAFISCTSLRQFDIPSSVANITFSVEGNPFNNCTALTKICVDSKSEHYKSVDGMLMSRDGTRLLKVPSCRRKVKIPITTKHIGVGAFDRCDSIISLDIPACVSSLDSYSIEQCKSLREIRVPASVTSVGKFAFNGCQNVTSIYFGGDNPLHEECCWSINKAAVIYILKGSRGWGVVPGEWGRYKIRYFNGASGRKKL